MKDHDIKAIILDMDGVLWRGTEPIGDLQAIFAKIRIRGWRTGFVTNNATRSVDFYTDKLRQFGVFVDKNQVLTSAQSAGEYLSGIFPTGGRVFIIGEQGLVDILKEFGFHHSDNKPLAIVVGLDRDLTYEKIRQATQLLRAGALFIGTNPDPTLPTPDGIIPGAGAILAAIEVASGCKPRIMGKPNPEIYRLSLARLGVAPDQTLVIGDRLDTDIAGGIASGCLTALVLSGDIQRKDLEDSDIQPDYVAQDLAALIDML